MSRFPLLVMCCSLVIGGWFWSLGVNTPVARAAAVSAAADLPLRDGASPDSMVLLVVPAGAALSIDGPPQGDFYPVTYSGTAGWAPGADLVIVKDDTMTAPASEGGAADDAAAASAVTAQPTAAPVDLAPTSATSADSAPAAAAPAIPTDVATVTAAAADPPEASQEKAAPTEMPTEAPIAEPLEATTPIPTVTGPATASAGASLLAGPHWSDSVVFSVPAGSTVTRTGRYVNGFVSADFMGIEGWIDASLLAEPLPMEPEPTATPAPVSTTAPSIAAAPTESPTTPVAVGGPGSGVAYPATDLTLRSGPSASYDALATIPAGEPVSLTGVMESGFVRVEYDGQVGWLATDSLSMPADPTPATSPRGTEARRVYSRQEIVQIIYDAADRYRQPRADMLRVAECESNLDPYAVNPSGSYGLFQFIDSTWQSTPYADRDVFDPRANANAAGWMWSVGRRGEWVCR